MLHKTRGIVLNYIKHGETSIVAHIYTELFGRQSYIINGVRSSHSKTKLNLFQPLTILNIEAYFKPKRELQRIKEVKNHVLLYNIPYDINKSSIAIFIAEILYKTLNESETNPTLFNFLCSSIEFLDLSDKGISNFHLAFLLHLSKHLGIFPQIDLSCFFYDNLKEQPNNMIDYRFFKNLPEKAKKGLLLIYEKPYQHLGNIKLDKSTRVILIAKLIDFYKIHFENITSIKSLEVLKEVYY